MPRKRQAAAASAASSLAGPSAKKRQAFNVPKSAKVKATIERNASQSPLLRLPAEIRDKIWRMILGDRTIRFQFEHISEFEDFEVFDYYKDFDDVEEWKAWSYRDPNHEMQHCQFWDFAERSRHKPSISESARQFYQQLLLEAYEKRYYAANYFPDPEDDLDPEYFWDLHDELCGCEGYDSDHEDIMMEHLKDKRDDKLRQPIQLQLLRVCRQIYLEANPILWSTNAFAFNSGKALATFVASRNPLQRKSLRSLMVVVEGLHWRDLYQWDKYLKLTTLKSIPNVRHLQVCFDSVFLSSLFPAASDGVTPIGEGSLFLKHSWLGDLKALPLQRIDFTIREGRAEHCKAEPFCLEWAAEFQKYIMACNGPEWLKQQADDKKRLAQLAKGRIDEWKASHFCRQLSQAACIEARQRRSDKRNDKAEKMRRTISDHCGQLHRSCKPPCAGNQCEHIEHPTGTQVAASSPQEDETQEVQGLEEENDHEQETNE